MARSSRALFGDRDAEFLENPLRQIDQPPAHHAMDRRNRATLDHLGDGLTLEVIELGRLPRRLAVHESVRPARVEVQHPVPDDLKPDAADLGRLGARRTVIDRRKRQKPPGLRAIFVFFAKPRSCDASKSWRNGIGADMTNLLGSPS